jgi:hypothetical protein
VTVLSSHGLVCLEESPYAMATRGLEEMKYRKDDGKDRNVERTTGWLNGRLDITTHFLSSEKSGWVIRR